MMRSCYCCLRLSVVAVAAPLLCALPDTGVGAAEAGIEYQTELSPAADVILDVRPQSQCVARSLAQARCLPVEDLLAQQKRLANFSGLFWLLGTVGLNGSEHVSIVGDHAQRREFIAGFLLVAGQAKIDIVSSKLSDLLDSAGESAKGRPRATTRSAVFTAPAATHRLLLKSELHALLDSSVPPVILDGRPESEYWGRAGRGLRGGHIPGAMHAPSPEQLATLSGQLPVAYAHDSVTGLAYLARLAASGIESRLYLGGWIEWAGDSTLPVDAETFAPAGARVNGLAATPSTVAAPESGTLRVYQRLTVALLLLCLLLAASACYLACKKRSPA